MTVRPFKASQLLPSCNAAQKARPNTFPFGLGGAGLHEIAEERHGDMVTVTGFALAAIAEQKPSALLWIVQESHSRDHGHLYHPGHHEAANKLPPLLTVICRKRDDALWVIEEALRAQAASHILAEIDPPDFTATRRLTLACQKHGGSIILALPHHAQGSTSALSRWRVRSSPSAHCLDDADGIGTRQWQAQLERSRITPHATEQKFYIHYQHGPLSLSLVDRLAPDALAGQQSASLRPSPTSSTPMRAYG